MDKSIAQSLTVVESGHGFTGEQIEIIKNSVAKGVSDQELAYFLEVCRSTGLNPLHRQIYAIMRSGKMTIQTGIDGYRLLAHRSRRHVGTDDAVYDTESAPHPNKATVTVYKFVAGQRCAYTATARWKEYAQESNNMWTKFPYLMLAKCAESLALRKAFPAETSGIYTDDEMMQADRVDNSVPAQIAAPVTVVEETPPTQAVDYKKSAQDRWNELHARALKFGFKENVWKAALEKYPTTAAMTKALDEYEAQQSAQDLEDVAEAEAGWIPEQHTEAEWNELYRRSLAAGFVENKAEWEQLLEKTGGSYEEILTPVEYREQHDLHKLPAGKGRH
jgi:phage recombination protein Bet